MINELLYGGILEIHVQNKQTNDYAMVDKWWK